MKNRENKNTDAKRNDIYPDISVKKRVGCPETAEEMVNSYGTYNIQPTSNTDNDFPAIAQGENKIMKNRSLHFFRDGDDPNPAKDSSDGDCVD